MIELTEIDIDILRFIFKSESASLVEIKSKFPKASSIEYRVKLLSTPEYRRLGNLPISNPVPNSSYLSQDYEEVVDGNVTKQRLIDMYRLTEAGRKFLQDNIRTTKSGRRDLWIKNAWIPIIVAFATTLLTNYILPRLLQLLESLFHTP